MGFFWQPPPPAPPPGLLDGLLEALKHAASARNPLLEGLLQRLPFSPSDLTFSPHLAAIADDCHLTLDALVVAVLLASIFANHTWRAVVFVLAYFVLVPLSAHANGGACPVAWTVSALLWPALYLACMYVPVSSWLNRRHRKLPAEGGVFVTGADSGMGLWTASALAGQGYVVFSGLFNSSPTDVFESVERLRAKVKAEYGEEAAGRIIPVPLDVTSDRSVAAAAATVRAHTSTRDPALRGRGLVGVVNCAGMGYNGPAEYFPIDLLQRQMDVNFYGYVRVVQAMMPHLKAAAASPGARRGRVVFIGTGGGVMSPSPPLLCAYMASKWAIEAFCGTLRMEMQLRELPIDACMLNPGFIKPTALISGGLPLTDRMWAACPAQAKAEYGPMLDEFIAYSYNEPGTHVSKVAEAMVEIMGAGRPQSSTKVGPDSKVAPFVGMLPTGLREAIVKISMYKRLGAT